MWHNPPVPAVLSLESVLGAGSVVLDVPLAGKAEALAQASRMLAEVSGVPAAAIEAALSAREALGSTAVGSGIALPHARLHVLRSTHAVLLRLRPPIGFEASDGEPVSLMCAVIAPDNPRGDLLVAVSAFAKAFRDPARAEALRQAETPAALRDLLLGAR